MIAELDSMDRRILDLVQAGVPLTMRPFAAMARDAGISEAEMIHRVRALKETRRIIRQIGAIFDSAALGYRSSLVAARIDARRLDEAAAIINRHPGVSHNYRREHEFNLWYTLAVPPDGKLGLEQTLAILHAESGALSTRALPTLTRYKIGVKLDISGDSPQSKRRTQIAPKSAGVPAAGKLTEADKAIIRVAQSDLPLTEKPFEALAQQASCTAEELIKAIERFEQEGKMRRFAAVLRHREAGFTANGMGTWVVARGEEDRFGALAAGFPEVSHCYLRPTYPDWPYNIFTMVHAQSTAGCEDVLRRISEASGVTRYNCLYSTHEFKKIRVKYFTSEIPAWEEAHLKVQCESGNAVDFSILAAATVE